MNHAPDEVLSALIDGEPLPSGDAAHLDACVECQERLQALRNVVVAVGAPVAMPSGHVREAAVAAALVETTGVVPALRRLAPRRERPQHAARTSRRLSTVSAAAVLVVALGVGGWMLRQVGRDEAKDATTANTASNLDTASDSAELGVGADAGNSSPFSAATPAAGGTAALGSAPTYHEAGDIGAFSDVAAVAAHYWAYAPRAGDERVEPPQCPLASDQALVWHASLTYKGEAAFARVTSAPDSARTLQVLRRTDCVLLESQAL